MATAFTVAQSQVGDVDQLGGPVLDPFTAGVSQVGSGSTLNPGGLLTVGAFTVGASAVGSTDALNPGGRIYFRALTDSAGGQDAFAANRGVPFVVGASAVGSTDLLGGGDNPNLVRVGQPFTVGISQVGGLRGLNDLVFVAGPDVTSAVGRALTDVAGGVDLFGFLRALTDSAGGTDSGSTGEPGQGTFGFGAFGDGTFGGTRAFPSNGPFIVGESQVGGLRQLGGFFNPVLFSDSASGVDALVAQLATMVDLAGGTDVIDINTQHLADIAAGFDALSVFLHSSYVLQLGMVLA